MTCIKCPHSAEIESFKAWQRGGRSGPSPITDDRRKELFDTCRKCGIRASARNGWGDTFEHRGQSQIMLIEDALTGSDAEGSLYSARDGYWESRTRDSSDGCTLLNPATEDALRVALATIFAFDPVEILLLRHILAGGTYASFNRPLRKLAERLAKYDLADDAPGFRSLAHTWSKRMIDAMPALEDLFRATVGENGGKTHPLRF